MRELILALGAILVRLVPVALDVGPDGALYVALPAIGANTGQGVILRLAVDGEVATPMADAGGRRWRDGDVDEQ